MSRRHSPGPHGAWWMDDRPAPEAIRFRWDDGDPGPETGAYIHMMELTPGVDVYVPLAADTSPGAWYTTGLQIETVTLAETLTPRYSTVQDYVQAVWEDL